MRLSACSIVKNEAENIARSIESYKDVVDEIIIVDTGSTDDTVAICESLGAKVFHFAWINDFAAAKNYAISKARGDWIIFLDADEWFVPQLDQRIYNVLKKVEKMDGVKAMQITSCNIDMRTGFISSKNRNLRIFKNSTGVNYVGKIHEEIHFNGKAVKSVTLNDIEIYHSGYAEGKGVQKARRNLEILTEVYKRGQADTSAYFYLCRENASTGNFSLALKFYDLFFKQPDYEQVIASSTLHVNIYELGIKIKQALRHQFTQQDILKDINAALNAYPELPAHHYFKGFHLFRFDPDEALKYLLQAIKLHKGYKGRYQNTFGGMLPDAYWKIAQIYKAGKEIENSYDYLILSLKEKPMQEGPFNDLIRLIRDQPTEDIVLFLNSLYDLTDRDQVAFLARQLMCSRLHKVFLYYALKYNQEFDGQDETTYLAMILANQAEQAVETGMTAYFNAGEDSDRFYATLAMLYHARKDLFEQYRSTLDPVYANLLNNYFKGESIANPGKKEIVAFLNLYRYLFYIGSTGQLLALEGLFAEMPKEAAAGVMGYYVQHKDHALTITQATRYLQAQQAEHFKTQMYKIIGYSYYSTGDYTDAFDYLTRALQSKHIDIDYQIIIHLKLLSTVPPDDILRLKAQKQYEIYAQVFKDYLDYQDMLRTGKIEASSKVDYDLLLIKDMEQEGFLAAIEPAATPYPDLVKDNLFAMVEKYLERSMDVSAHQMLLRLLRQDYKKDVLYYYLGQIYNQLQNPTLSLYCHRQAFKENAALAETIINDTKNENRHYIYQSIDCDYIENCPICGKAAALHSVYNTITSPDFSIHYPAIKEWNHCAHCRHLFAARVPHRLGEIVGGATDETVEGGPTSPDVVILGKGLGQYRPVMELIGRHANGNRLLDVGCGYGQFLAVAMEYGYAAHGIEPNPQLADFCSGYLDGVVYNTTFANFDADVARGKPEPYHVVTMLRVLENMREPLQAIGKAASLLGQDGLLYIETPNFDSGYARLMQDKNKTLYSSPMIHYFSRESLIKLLEGQGFVLVSHNMSRVCEGYMEVLVRRV